MSTEDRDISPGSDLDLAIERALEAANLRAGGGSESASTAVVVEDWEPSAAEAGGGATGVADGD